VEALAAHDIALVRADNPGPFTLSGTNTWVVGRDPAHVVDPGPSLPEHVEAVAAEVERRGGLGGIALTHAHADHAEAVSALQERCGAVPVAASAAPVAAALEDADVALDEGARFGPLLTVATPGHSPDHLAFVAGTVCFSGDAVLGEGSVYVAPDPGAMAGYLDGLRRLRALQLELICPGHGPPVDDPAAKLDEYIEHRLDRERRLVAALDRGLRSEVELLDEVWDDVPPGLRPAAAVTLRAHLGKLGDEGRAPDGAGEPRLD
jgi:glyoxylase-like metal-dependent hydrolase (beta-lactamase superfamily II)